MVRRTISVSKTIDDIVLRRAERDGSYSAAVANLVEAGTRRLGEAELPPYVGSGSGPTDLGRAAERYLRRAAKRI